jgi:hypothetical protein
MCVIVHFTNQLTDFWATAFMFLHQGTKYLILTLVYVGSKYIFVQ